MTLNHWFTLAYLVLGGALTAVELIGVHRHAKDGDTITENWRWVDTALKPHGGLRWLWRVATIGLLGWTAFHFAGAWG